MSGPEVFGSNPYAENRVISGELVTVLRGVTDERGLKLERYRSRAVGAGQVHELMITDTPGVAPGDTVDRVALIGFVEVSRSGVLLVGSRVMVGEHELGVIAGFDDTHMPNHQNICLQTANLQDGVQLGLVVGELVRFDSEIL
jgi:Family of unknown function (DUF6917)